MVLETKNFIGYPLKQKEFYTREEYDGRCAYYQEKLDTLNSKIEHMIRDDSVQWDKFEDLKNLYFKKCEDYDKLKGEEGRLIDLNNKLIIENTELKDKIEGIELGIKFKASQEEKTERKKPEYDEDLTQKVYRF